MMPDFATRQHLIDRALLLRSCLWLGMTEAALAMAAFFGSFVANGISGDWPQSGQAYQTATTLALGAVVAGQVGNVLVHRGSSAFPGRLLWIAIFAELALFAAVAYLGPLQRAFGTAPLDGVSWLYLALCPLVLAGVDAVRRRLGSTV